jgi:hypothetical protein
VTDLVSCAKHGERQPAFVCTHLVGESFGLGFNTASAATDENPFPDAWCDDCELIRAAHNGWNEESEKLTKISLICSGCYKRARIRNTLTADTLDNLSGVRWQCGTCDRWHTGPCLDFGFQTPFYWTKEHDSQNRFAWLKSWLGSPFPRTFLNDDYCAIDGSDFFIRGLIELPVVGTDKHLVWGVWGSLSRQHFESVLKMNDDPGRVKLTPMFSWMSNRLSDYPETLNLKMHAHVREPGLRPTFELEPTDHPLAQEFHLGISPRRVKEIMKSHLPAVE